MITKTRINRALAQWFGRNSVRNRIAMLHTARCGSTVLGNMLNRHSMVHWGGELFAGYMPDKVMSLSPINVSQVIRRAELTSGKPIFGFETKYPSMMHLCPECINMELDEYCNSLRNLGYSQFIVLHRRNHLRRVVSTEVGRMRGKWHDSTSPAAPTRVRISIDAVQSGITRCALLELFDRLDREYAWLQALLAESETLYMVYEDDIQADPRQAYEKACEFLRIPVEQVSVPFERSTPFALVSVVENYDEVAETLRGTQYEWMLNELTEASSSEIDTNLGAGKL